MKKQIKLCLCIASCCICFAAFAQESKPGSVPSVPSNKVTPQIARAEASTVAVVVASPTVNTNQYQPSGDKAEAAACTRNLEQINAAIQAYQKDNKAVPDWL